MKLNYLGKNGAKQRKCYNCGVHFCDNFYIAAVIYFSLQKYK